MESTTYSQTIATPNLTKFKHYVIFDGTSSYIIPQSDIINIDEDTEVLYGNDSIDICDTYCEQYLSKYN